ncbi:MAG TPA: glycosyl hydrolase family 28-related protein [Polyangia bacterium]
MISLPLIAAGMLLAGCGLSTGEITGLIAAPESSGQDDQGGRGGMGVGMGGAGGSLPRTDAGLTAPDGAANSGGFSGSGDSRGFGGSGGNSPTETGGAGGNDARPGTGGAGGSTGGGTPGGTTEPPPADHRPPAKARGARVPYWQYEAETAKHTGVAIGPSRIFGNVAAEASGREAVRLERAGQKIEFVTECPTNSIVVRFSIPDATAGGGITATLGLYIGGVRKESLKLTSRYAWTYGDADAQGLAADRPGAGTPHHFYDEVHTMFAEVPAGTTIALQRDAQDTAAFYVIDLVDFEHVAPPLAPPPGSLSILDFGATANDTTDDGPAIQRAIEAARKQNKVLHIPAGTFLSTTAPWVVSDVTIRGAGMWHSVLQGYWAQFKVNGTVQFHDFALFGDVTHRDDQKGDNGFDGAAGTGSRLDNVWIEHHKVGWWVGKGGFVGQVTQPMTDGLLIRGARIRNTFADGVNFANGTRNSVIEHSNFRNNGDDAIATWSYAVDGPLPCENNVFRFNTVETTWRANCFAIYGGKSNRIEDNVCADTSNYPGINLASTFTAIPFSGTTVVQRNTLLRAGGPHYGQEFGALRIFADQSAIAGIQIRDIQIDSPTFSGIHFGGAHSANGISLDNIQVNNYGTLGLWITAEARGNVSANNVTVTGAVNKGIQNDTRNAFILEKGTGNVGW